MSDGLDESARAELRRRLERAPDDAFAWRDLWKLETTRQNWDGAVEWLRHAFSA